MTEGEEQKVGSVRILTLKKKPHFQKQQNLSNVKCSSWDTVTTPKEVTLLTEKKPAIYQISIGFDEHTYLKFNKHISVKSATLKCI